ncbi:MAG: hypothetical protein DIZ80_09165 [endosymbiont of Galathealinum brachiosum]|uniref:Uncharacterized protein n=1 Tax=endosymbiont of Galathealinum brachiosum TaxID=2200906 RepID=A0A370DC53_9GAMM|nr:MAG: hypothetical protein DIZ80_09165 [endosymbiont of Galathealinum brachiosum]
MIFYKKSLFIIGLLSLISACSSSGGGGPTAATLSADNAQDLAIAATESTKQAVTADSANFLAKTSNTANTTDLISNKVREIAFEATSLGPVSAICPFGGTYSDSISAGSTSASGSITFSQCGVADGITITGVVTFSGNESNFTITYNNLSITGLGVTETVNASVSCSTSGSSFSCTTNTSITGIDGRTYAVSNISVSGDEFSGYDVNATVVDPTHGSITITATDITFNCTGSTAGRPSSGTITFTSDGRTGSVTFNSCNSYTVTLDGVATPYTWITPT